MFNLLKKGIPKIQCLLLMTDFFFCESLGHHFISIWEKVLKNGPSQICGRLLLKKFEAI